MAEGIDGNKVVGAWRDSSRIFHGYLFDGTNFSKLDDYGANGTYPYGISGSNIVGVYTDSNGTNHGFLFNGTSYTTLDHPLGTNGTYTLGISGNNIVGYYTDGAGQNHGFELATAPPAGLSISLYAGLTITGTVGKTFNIQSTTDLADNNSWTTIASITLTQPVQLWVDTSVNVATSGKRFYRIVSVP